MGIGPHTPSFDAPPVSYVLSVSQNPVLGELFAAQRPDARAPGLGDAGYRVGVVVPALDRRARRRRAALLQVRDGLLAIELLRMKRVAAGQPDERERREEHGRSARPPGHRASVQRVVREGG